MALKVCFNIELMVNRSLPIKYFGNSGTFFRGEQQQGILKILLSKEHELTRGVTFGSPIYPAIEQRSESAYSIDKLCSYFEVPVEKMLQHLPNE